MAVPVYSTRFGCWHHETGTVGVLNDTGQIWVIRCITVYNGNDLEVNTFALGDYFNDAVLVYYNTGLAPGSWYFEWQGRIVVPPSTPEIDNGFVWEAGGFPVDVYVGGYTLSGP